MKKTLAAILSALLLMSALAGCGTYHGASAGNAWTSAGDAYVSAANAFSHGK